MKILGLSEDKIGWISVVLTQASLRRLGLHLRRRLSASMLVEYSAQIPKDASEDVSIASDPSAIEIEVQTAIQDAENASGFSYGVIVDSASVAALTNDLESSWAAESGVPYGEIEVGTTSTTPNTPKQFSGLTSASDRKKTSIWTLLVVHIAMACCALIAP